jgi:ABC-2 type transport system ATP-binding protein
VGQVLKATLACAVIGLFVAAPASAGQVSKLTYSVPVTQPDELGQPVAIDTDVYLPDVSPPKGGFPFVVFFHGGGSDKTNGFDAGHARFFARHGYATLIYSARGHGSSGGQTTVAGPKEMRDTYDVIAWALGIGGRDHPTHPNFHIDRSRIGLSGYSQGGLNTNLAEVYASDHKLDPYGIHFKVLTPGNTPDRVYQALIPFDVVKLSFGVGLMETYFVGAHAHVSPLLEKWIGTATANLPDDGSPQCQGGKHDTPTSAMKADLAARSVGCHVDRMTAPSHWAQALDDELFPTQMAVHMWRRMPNRGNHLYLSMGGHGAPAAPDAVERDKLLAQLAFVDHYLRGRPLHQPNVVYWARDPDHPVPGDAYKYPDEAWEPHHARTWPPPGTKHVRYELSADGRAVRHGAVAGTLPLAPLFLDEAHDPVALAALSGSPLGTSPAPSSVPATSQPGSVAGFELELGGLPREIDGAATARFDWTPASPDSQVVVQLLDRGPDGTLTLLERGVRGIRGATPGAARSVRVTTNQFSARIEKGHSLLAWVMAADPLFYKPYPGSDGGTLAAGPDATLSIPFRG